MSVMSVVVGVAWAIGFAIVLAAMLWAAVEGYIRWHNRQRMKYVPTPYGAVRAPSRRELQRSRKMHPKEGEEK